MSEKLLRDTIQMRTERIQIIINLLSIRNIH